MQLIMGSHRQGCLVHMHNNRPGGCQVVGRCFCCHGEGSIARTQHSFQGFCITQGARSGSTCHAGNRRSALRDADAVTIGDGIGGIPGDMLGRLANGGCGITDSPQGVVASISTRDGLGARELGGPVASIGIGEYRAADGQNHIVARDLVGVGGGHRRRRGGIVITLCHCEGAGDGQPGDLRFVEHDHIARGHFVVA